MWNLVALVEFEFDENHQTVWKDEVLCTGTIRQCMEHALTLVPKYHGWGLGSKWIVEAWENVFRENLDFVWLDRKHEYFYVERVGRENNATGKTDGDYRSYSPD